METKFKREVSPPFSDETFVIRLTDFGHGDPRLTVAPLEDATTEYNFTVTNESMNECQWRDADEDPPLDVLKAVEAAGYHVIDVTERPEYGLYENVKYLEEAVTDISENLHRDDIISRAALNWAEESLNSLKTLELLRSELSDTEFQVILFKAQQSSDRLPNGNLTIPQRDGSTESARLKSVVTLMVAYAQRDGYLDTNLLNDELVERLTTGEKSNE
jgi:hypothetical protein